VQITLRANLAQSHSLQPIGFTHSPLMGMPFYRELTEPLGRYEHYFDARLPLCAHQEQRSVGEAKKARPFAE
jgi:hypothetical protein